MMEAILLSILSNVIFGAGKHTHSIYTKHKGIESKVRGAYLRALERWTPNKILQAQKKPFLRKSIESLRNYIENPNQELDRELKYFLEYFRIELMGDSVTYNIIHEFGRETSLENQYAILQGQDELKSLLKDICASQFKSQSWHKKEINCNAFIQHIAKTPNYISRSVQKGSVKIDEEANCLSFEKGSILEALQNLRRIILVAPAGMGKSVEMIQSAFSLATIGYFPIHVTLNLYESNKGISGLFPEGWHDVPDSKLVIFLDGFDEVESQDRYRVKKQVQILIQDHPDALIAISCRSNFYEQPNNWKSGSIKNFIPCYLEELTFEDIKSHIEQISGRDGEEFMQLLLNSHFYNIAINPFYLKIIIPYYLKHGHINVTKVQLMDEFINRRFFEDEEHFQESVELGESLDERTNLLQKIALVFDLIGERIISLKEIKKLISDDELSLVRHCGIFQKSSDGVDKWKFEHNHFQEYFSASILSQLAFQEGRKYYCFEGYDKVKPGWFNTVSYLVSISADSELIDFLSMNHPEVLVLSEKEILSEQQRQDIYKGIFNTFKQKKIWLNLNGVSERDMARFAQSDAIIEFLLLEIENTENHRRVVVNALSLFEGLRFGSPYPEGFQRLRAVAKVYTDDPYIVSGIIDAVGESLVANVSLITLLLDDWKNDENENIRSIFYRLIEKFKLSDKYIDYIIKGYKIVSKRGGRRGDVSLGDEGWNLESALLKISKPESILELSNFYINEDFLRDQTFSDGLLQKLIVRFIDIYRGQEIILIAVFNMYLKELKDGYRQSDDRFLPFFKKTDTIGFCYKLALRNFFDSDDLYISSVCLSQFIEEENVEELIECIRTRKIKEKKLLWLYQDLKRIKPPLAATIKHSIGTYSDIDIKETQGFDGKKQRQQKAQEAFDILFHKNQFKEECLRVFEEKDTLSKYELYEIRRANYYVQELEDFYNEAALWLIRDLANENSISKKSIELWFQEHSDFDWFAISRSCYYLRNNDEIKVSEYQLDFYREWFNKKIDTVDFSKDLRPSGRSYQFSFLAEKLSFLIKRFNFHCEEQVWKDLTLFILHDSKSQNGVSMQLIAEKLGKEKLDNTIIEHILSDKLEVNVTRESHFGYAIENSLKECYDKIIETITNGSMDEYHELNYISLLIKDKSNSNLLINHYARFTVRGQIRVIEELVNSKQNAKAQECLEKIDYPTIKEEFQKQVINLYVKLNLLKGLKLGIRFMEQTKKSPFGQHNNKLVYFSSSEALPLFWHILKMSYDEEIATEHSFDKLWPIVIDGIEHLAVQSAENFKLVIDQFEEFIHLNIGKITDVEFCYSAIDRIKKLYYEDKAQNYSVDKAIEIVKRFM